MDAPWESKQLSFLTGHLLIPATLFLEKICGREYLLSIEYYCQGSKSLRGW
jgi:hypothetical protein